MEIKEEFEALTGASEPVQSASATNIALELAKMVSLDLKSLSELYNDYAVTFELWETCLEMLYYSTTSGNVAYSSSLTEVWTKEVDQSKGDVDEACSVLKRFGSYVHQADIGAGLPLQTLCLHLDKAALERLESGAESIGDKDVRFGLFLLLLARAPQKLYCSVIITEHYCFAIAEAQAAPSQISTVILRQWAMSAFAHRMSTSASLMLDSAKRYVSEVRRLDLPQMQQQTEAVNQLSRN